MSESKFYHISPAGKLTVVAGVPEALRAARDGGFLWLHYHQPRRDELSALIEPLGLHPLSIEDCFDDDQVPKIEDYHKNTFILFNAIEYADGKLSIDEVDLFIGRNFLVSVTHADSTNALLLTGMEQVVERNVDSAREG